MRYMLLLYDNADTRDAFFGPGSESLGAEVDAVLAELKARASSLRPIRSRTRRRPRRCASAAAPR